MASHKSTTGEDTHYKQKTKMLDQVLSAKDTLISLNVSIEGQQNSLRLEVDMCIALDEICRREQSSIDDVCIAVIKTKPDALPLCSAIRCFILNYFRSAATEEGHMKAEHGCFLLGYQTK